MLRSVLLLLFLVAIPTAHASVTLNVRDFGATGNGKTLDTPAIQRAIDQASTQGGTVIVPQGSYLSGSIFIKSGVTLNLEHGATILGSQSLNDYPMMPTRVAGIEMSWPAALVNIYAQHDASITGEGTIDGDGKIFWDSYWTLRKSYEPRGLRWASDYDAKRPRLVQVYNSSHVRLTGLMLRRSGFWTVHLCYSQDITLDGLTIRNNEDGHGPSTDGIDIDSSQKVTITHADIAVNDDALCFKAGRDFDGLRVHRPTQDVVIRDSIVRAGAAGVTFGSETSGGFRNIDVSGIRVLAPVPVGILFKSAHTRGGFGTDLRIHDFQLVGVQVAIRITMNWNPAYSYATIPPGIKDYPPYWTTLATPVPEQQGKAHFSDVHLFNISGTAKTAFEVDAFPDVTLDRFHLDHIDLTVDSAGHIADARDWTFNSVLLHSADPTPVALHNTAGFIGAPKP